MEVLILFGMVIQITLGLKYDSKEGRCPIIGDDINSNVKDSLDHNSIIGNWINIYDRKQLNKHLQCYAI